MRSQLVTAVSAAVLCLATAPSARAAAEGGDGSGREVRAGSPSARGSAADSLRLYTLDDDVVVSAAKLPVRRSDMAASVTVLPHAVLRASAAQTLPEVLSLGAGLHTYDFDGNGMRAAVESRGFAAFGETSYLRFQVAGIPFGDLAEDAAPWDLLDLDQLERVEIIRSASSTLHGNTAFTGVVNLVPFGTREAWAIRAKLGGGSYERREGTVTAGWRHARSSGTGSLHVRAIDGWRDHSEWRGRSAFATLASADDGATRARLGVFHTDSESELPGPIPRAVADNAPETASTPFDQDDVTRLHVTGIFESTPGASTPFSTSVYFQTEDKQLTETIFEQTQREQRETFRYGGQASVRLATASAGVDARLLAGIEGSFGEMRSAFRSVGESGGLFARTADADVHRDAVGGYVSLEVDPVPALTLAVGVRRDDIWAELDPADDDPSGASPSEKIMKAWSPSASVNVRVARQSHAFVLVSSSFKTPTLTQLYELRPFFTEFGPISISNAALEPQHATQVELGVQSAFTPWASIDLALYTMKAEDEIGFDLSTFSFANIGESTHRGLEAGVTLRPLRGVAIDLGHALTIAAFDGSFGGNDVDGNQINNVPKYLSRAGVRYSHRYFTVGGSVLDVREQWADEGNTVEIPDYTVVDAFGSVTFAAQEVYAKVRNILDESYAPAGFVTLDPETGGPLPLFYPAAGRRVEVGVRVALD